VHSNAWGYDSRSVYIFQKLEPRPPDLPVLS